MGTDKEPQNRFTRAASGPQTGLAGVRSCVDRGANIINRVLLYSVVCLYCRNPVQAEASSRRKAEKAAAAACHVAIIKEQQDLIARGERV